MVDLSDAEKLQEMAGVAVAQLRKLKEIAGTLQTLRTEFNALNLDVTGTPLEGRAPALAAWIDMVRAAADNPAANSLIQ